MRAFDGLRSNASSAPNRIWQMCDSRMPFRCEQCSRSFAIGGKRWLGSSISTHSLYRAACLCDDCYNKRDINAQKRPKLADRRTEL